MSGSEVGCPGMWGPVLTWAISGPVLTWAISGPVLTWAIMVGCATRAMCNVRYRHRLHCEIKYKKPQFQDNLYHECAFLYLISGCEKCNVRYRHRLWGYQAVQTEPRTRSPGCITMRIPVPLMHSPLYARYTLMRMGEVSPYAQAPRLIGPSTAS
eukprot:1521451-Rhodomonas_salina.2